MRWVIQKNLTNAEDHDRIRDACIKYYYEPVSVSVVPFSSDLPDVPTDGPTVFYGGTNFIATVHKSGRWTPGTFFSPVNFTSRSYVEHYTDHMISYPCEFTTLGKFSASGQPSDKLFFIRPDKDMKEFAGDVMEFDKILKWDQRLGNVPGCDLVTADTEIMVSEPYGIAHEWRVFVVGGKVSSGSHYRRYLRLEPEAGLPDNVIAFVEEMCKIWTPAGVFVMDVAESAGNLYIVECNCFNSSGFYHSNVEKVVHDVSEYIAG